MNDWRYTIRIFLTTLVIGLGGILPAAGCTGGCGTCFQCAGLGGLTAIFTALGIVRKRIGAPTITDRLKPIIDCAGEERGTTVVCITERPATK